MTQPPDEPPPYEDDDGSEQDDAPLRSRTEARRELQKSESDLMELSRWLVAQRDRVLVKLNLAEDALSAIHDAHRIENPSARKRALRLVRTALRGADIAALKNAIEDLSLGTPMTEAQVAADDWCARLVTGGEDDLSAFVGAHSAADRQQLRQLVRNAKKAHGGDARKATETRQALSKSLADAIREQANATSNDEDG